MFGAPGSAACAAAAKHDGHDADVRPALPARRARQRDLQDLHAGDPGPGRAAAARRDRVRGQVLVVPQGTVVLQAANPSANHADSSSTTPTRAVLRAQGQRRAARQRTSPTRSRAPTRPAHPDVTFGFNSKGGNAFQNVTGQIAQRGQLVSALGQTLNQHFAVALDNQLVTVPLDRLQASTRTGSPAAAAPTSPAASRPATASDLANQLRLGALPINLKLISESQVSATLGKQALHQGLVAGAVGLLVVALFLLVYYRVLGLIAVAGAGRLRALLLRADQADPDHADAAGHRRSDPDDRRRRGRQHRHLRTRQGGDPRRALDPPGDRDRLPARA